MALRVSKCTSLCTINDLINEPFTSLDYSLTNHIGPSSRIRYGKLFGLSSGSGSREFFHHQGLVWRGRLLARSRGTEGNCWLPRGVLLQAATVIGGHCRLLASSRGTVVSSPGVQKN